MLYGYGYTAQVCGWNAYQDLHRIFDLNDPIRAKYPGTTITLSACRQLRQFAHPPQDISQPGYRATLFPLPASFVFSLFFSVGWNKEASKPSQDNRLASHPVIFLLLSTLASLLCPSSYTGRCNLARVVVCSALTPLPVSSCAS